MSEDYFDLMSDSLARRWAVEKERIEERGNPAPDEVEARVFQLVFGRLFRACVYYRRHNLTMISRRLGFSGGALREALDNPRADQTPLVVALADPEVDFNGWLAEIRDNHDFFTAMARNVSSSWEEQK